LTQRIIAIFLYTISVIRKMLYFWITNASRAHRAGRNDGSGKNTPISCSSKGYLRKGRRKELSESPTKACSETQLDKIVQKTTPPSSLAGSTTQVTIPNGSVDVTWLKSRPRGSSSEGSSSNPSASVPYPIEKQHKIYTRKTSSTSLW